MANKSSKIIFLLFIPIFVALVMTYIQNVNQLGWRDIDGFELKITGDIDQIEEFYTSLEERLIGYPDWINIVLTGELSKVQRDYAPFRSSIDMFQNYNKIYTSADMSKLLLEYSNYLEIVLFNNKGIKSNVIVTELRRLFQFCSISNDNFVKNESVFIGDIIDVIKFDANPYFEPINQIQTIYISLHEKNSINSQLKEIRNQIQLEVNELTKLIDVDVSIDKRDFQITTIDNWDLLLNHEEYNPLQYSHIYNHLPSINSTEFNSRMTLMKQSIQHGRYTATSTAAEFLIILSKIEEQLIEFQFRGNFKNIYILEIVNRLVGDGAIESGILTSLINLLDDKRYRYKVNDFLSRSDEYLKTEIKIISELTYPTTQSLPNNLSSKYINGDSTLILKIK